MKPQQHDINSKRFALRIATMIDFFGMLNAIEDAEYADGLEDEQAAAVQTKYGDVIQPFSDLLDFFMPYFRRYVAIHRGDPESNWSND